MSKITVNREILTNIVKETIRGELYSWNLAKHRKNMTLDEIRKESIIGSDPYKIVALLEDLELATKLYNEIIEEELAKKLKEEEDDKATA
jgi:hypothetical protein